MEAQVSVKKSDYERILSDFAAAINISTPNENTIRNDCQINGADRPHPRIMIARNDSAAQVDGKTRLISRNIIGRASTGQSIPDSNNTGKRIGMTNCIA